MALNTTTEESRQSFYDRIDKAHCAPLWEVLHGLITPTPRTRCQPYLWKWATVFPWLEEAGQQRATELAAYFGVGKATMSRQLRALDELGLVTREPDPADGRASLVRLTEEGLLRFRRVRDARRDRYMSKLAGWDRGEVAELARLLHQLNARAGS